MISSSYSSLIVQLGPLPLLSDKGSVKSFKGIAIRGTIIQYMMVIKMTIWAVPITSATLSHLFQMTRKVLCLVPSFSVGVIVDPTWPFLKRTFCLCSQNLKSNPLYRGVSPVFMQCLISIFVGTKGDRLWIFVRTHGYCWLTQVIWQHVRFSKQVRIRALSKPCSGNPGGRPKGLVNRKIFQYYREALKFVRPIRVSSAETGSNFDRPPKNDW